MNSPPVGTRDIPSADVTIRTHTIRTVAVVDIGPRKAIFIFRWYQVNSAGNVIMLPTTISVIYYRKRSTYVSVRRDFHP